MASLSGHRRHRRDRRWCGRRVHDEHPHATRRDGRALSARVRRDRRAEGSSLRADVVDHLGGVRRPPRRPDHRSRSDFRRLLDADHSRAGPRASRQGARDARRRLRPGSTRQLHVRRARRARGTLGHAGKPVEWRSGRSQRGAHSRVLGTERLRGSRPMVPDRFAAVLEEMRPMTERIHALGKRLYLVGGTVRDLLIDKQGGDTDFDATTDAVPSEIKAALNGWADAIWTQGERFGTIGAKKGDRVYEITSHRAEVYTDDSRKPNVQFSNDIEVDLSRRDFTVNAMALELTRTDGEPPSLVDPYGGAADLATRTLRTPLRPEVSFSDDPLRMLRAARFIAGYDLEPVPELVAAVRAHAQRLEIVSAERIGGELDKLLVVPDPSAGLWFIVDTGLAEYFL